MRQLALCIGGRNLAERTSEKHKDYGFYKITLVWITISIKKKICAKGKKKICAKTPICAKVFLSELNTKV